MQTVEFSTDRNADKLPLHSRTNDGLEVVLEISFQYLYDFSRLFELFSTFKDQHKAILENMAVDALSEAATKYSAYDFFMDRQKIGVEMQLILNQHFKENCYATVEFFQLRSVDLPDEFEQAIQLSEVKKQEIRKAEAQKNRTIVELQTTKMTAEYQRNVTIVSPPNY